ncbi:MAG: hypothetical protein EPO21_15940 [Chloroflexota bacterium]|nr:MAG: hypothetical protein EPO21_15940 [Chloroflexota bacterium]
MRGIVLETLLWWFSAEVIGLVTLPITMLTFRNLADRGYALSKVLGLLLVGYLLWLGGVLHLVPNSRGSILLILFCLAIVSLILFGRSRDEITGFVRSHRTLILASEAVFAVALFAMAALRAYTPEIMGTEKPMDFAFLNAVLRSTYFPPTDPWLSGFSISYYYFGHILFGAVIKLAGTPAAIGYNLSLALIFALTASAVFGLVAGLVTDAGKGQATASRQASGAGGARAAIVFGVVGMCLVLVIGNFEAVLELIRAHGWTSPDVLGWFQIRDLTGARMSTTWYPSDPWWWWRATRVIGNLTQGSGGDYTITEFPFFSFLLGDLHPHVMALPFGMLALAFGYNLIKLSTVPDIKWLRRNVALVLLTGICLGALLFLNTWDFPTYFLIAAAALVIATQRCTRRWLLDLANLREAGPAIVTIGIVSVALYAPFLLGFQSQASGIVPLQQVRTWPVHFVIVMGLPIFLAVSFLVARLTGILRPASRDWSRLGWAALVALVPYLLWLALLVRFGGTAVGNSQPGEILGRFVQVTPALLLVALGIFLLDRRPSDTGTSTAESRAPDAFALLLVVIGVVLLAICELFFIKDVFGNRMNTVFKLYYQVWSLVAIVSAYGLYWINSRWHAVGPTLRLAISGWWLLVALLVLASLVYPVTSIFGKTNGFQATPTLDGLAYARASNPDEYEATSWLASNAPDGAVVVEATGGQYSEFGRISARTGIPTLLGWVGHENQWRGSDRDFRGRDAEIDAIYNASDSGPIQSILQGRKVTYVFVGQLERSKYGDGASTRLARFMDVVFRKGDVTIFKVR